MLSTCERNKDTEKNPKARDQRKNRIVSNLWGEVITKKGKNQYL